MPEAVPVRTPRAGFTLVELAVVVVIIGVLAAFGVPRYYRSVERSRASEAFNYLSAVRSSQGRYFAREGTFAPAVSALDITTPSPAFFAVGSVSAGSTGSPQNSWSLTLTRVGPSSGYGAYTVTFTDQGFDPADSSISTLPDILPIGG